MSDGVLCKCGYNMYIIDTYVIHDSLNGNHFCDMEFYCRECGRVKYIRCVEVMDLGLECEKDYKPCMEQREIILELNKC